MIDSTTVAPDAAIALGIASTAMPFARTREDEAERWLRVLRLHGEAGAALQAIGVSEGRIGQPHEHPHAHGHQPDAEQAGADPVERVIAEAVEIAARRGCQGVATIDLLLAVMCVYGEDFDCVLEAHGAERAELLQRLGVERDPSEICA